MRDKEVYGYDCAATKDQKGATRFNSLCSRLYLLFVYGKNASTNQKNGVESTENCDKNIMAQQEYKGE
jgi:hypothetical protein